MTHKFFFIKSATETKIFFLIFIFIYATIIQFSIYPFIVTSDGMTRIRLVDTIINGNISDTNSLLPFFPVLIQYIMFKIAENHALFSFTQIVLSIIASYFLLRRFIDSFSSYVVLILSFPFLIFFAIQTDSALIYISLVFGIESYLRYKDTQKTKYLIYFSILLCISVLIRPNAIPLSLIIIFLIFYHNKKIGIFYAILLFSVLFINKNNFFIYEQRNPLSLVFVYDIVGFLDSQSTNLNAYREVFDHDFGAGTTQNLLNRFNSCCLNSLVWDNNPPLPAYKISEIENYEKIKDIYIYGKRNHIKC